MEKTRRTADEIRSETGNDRVDFLAADFSDFEEVRGMAETFKEVQACRKSGIMINTFMLADDWYLVDFVKQMTAMTRGKAYFANPNNLTEFVLMDFMKRRTSRVR